MKILVPVKRVPDYEVKVKLNAAQDGVQLDGVKGILNPFDEIAVEEALKMKDARPEIEIEVLTIGPQLCSEQLRSALAMGADRGIHVVTDAPVDSSLAARAACAVFRKGDYKLILMGKQAIDSDANQTGQLIAAELGIPQATFASKLVVNDGGASALVTREVDGGLETIDVDLPAVVTTDLRLNTPRYVTLPNIVKAKKKPIAETSLAELGIGGEALVSVKKLSYPSARKGGVKVQSVSELVEKLKVEAKVI